MALSTEMTARNVAAHEAYRVVQKHGIDAGSEILKGYAAAFLLALGAVSGMEYAREAINEILPPPSGGKPRLVIDNQPA